MTPFNFITVRLGKDSIPDIKKICASEVGVLDNTFTINVKCTQVPDNYGDGDYAFLWLGSDNNKGIPTQWKQGFKAVGRVKGVNRGLSYNNTSETTIEIVYVFHEAVNRMDILRCAPIAYYWCSSMPLIGLDDHANQTIRNMTGYSFSDIRAFFYAIESVTKCFEDDIVKIEPMFTEYFDVFLPCPQNYPLAKNIDEIVVPEKKEKQPLQQIFYGAPGTGKSHRIKNDERVKAAEGKNLVFRTTFHPDSDYSTFVGAYKPTMQPVADKYKAVAGKDEEIAYSFVPQAFLQAYVAAWNHEEENVFLVIEEINRGNCAQIFGDLFQLLDRDDEGYSEYPIKADIDLVRYLEDGKDEDGQDVLKNKDGIKGGKLKLPKNLYIWATMNTSDQSLFPIDSAFKRRWEWVYQPIDTAKETWYVKVGEDYYSWTAFLNKVNDELLTDETAEDKHLGFYFCKATERKDGTEGQPNVITAEAFVGKVLFYLWGDVFKVYGIPSAIGGSKEWPYRKFYQTNGKVDEEKVAALMKQLKIDAQAADDNSKEVAPTE